MATSLSPVVSPPRPCARSTPRQKPAAARVVAQGGGNDLPAPPTPTAGDVIRQVIAKYRREWHSPVLLEQYRQRLVVVEKAIARQVRRIGHAPRLQKKREFLGKGSSLSGPSRRRRAR
jgi:hypothetical protein